uniref:Uncharacterized protein n=1 Tax=Arundo donax TaxID=35708 RepID=A0A0A9B5H9_ARUDO
MESNWSEDDTKPEG